MRILFMDTYYPGHFRFLAPYLVEKIRQSSSGHQVVFLSEFRRRDFEVDGLRQVTIRYDHAEQNQPQSEQIALNVTRQVEAFGHAMRQLRRQGFTPDIIIAAEPCNLEAADVFPDACCVAYFDWYYSPEIDDRLLARGKIKPEDKKPLHLRNPFQLAALLACESAIVPTAWQRDSYPESLRDRLTVLPMGVDVNFFRPLNRGEKLYEHTDPQMRALLKGPELITWSARNPSEYTGFSTVCQAVPRILAERPSSHFLMVSQNTQMASGHPDCARLLAMAPDRVHLFRHGTWNEYRAILQASAAHLYLSAAAPLPSSLLEAMSCSALLVASDTKSVRHVLQHNRTGLLTDFFSADALADTVIRALENPAEGADMRRQARRFVVENYAAQKLVPRHLDWILKVRAAHTGQERAGQEQAGLEQEEGNLPLW